MADSERVRARAEASFKKEERAREGAKAWTQYQAEANATLEKTARLRALRLARDAAAPTDAAPKTRAKPARRSAAPEAETETE
jgi:hypothetical protein